MHRNLNATALTPTGVHQVDHFAAPSLQPGPPHQHRVSHHKDFPAVMLPAAAGVAAYLLPQAIPHPAIGIISTIATYLLRLTAVGGIVTHTW
jgi:hypothetical protein